MTTRRRRGLWPAAWAGLMLPLVLLVLLLSLGFWLQTLRPPTSVPRADDPAPLTSRLPAEVLAEADAPVDAPAPEAPAEMLAELGVRIVRWPDGAPVAGAELVVATLAGDTLFDILPARGERVRRRLPPERWPLLVSAIADGHDGRTVRVEAPGEVVLELPAHDGWVVRVTDPLGAPHAGVELAAWTHWSPRPAWTWSRAGGQQLVAWESRGRVHASARSNAEGYVRIEPVRDADTFVDLLYAVEGRALASQVQRVVLPHAEQRLPDLVLRSVEPLQVVVLDLDGQPVRSATVELDGGPGRERETERVDLTDEHGNASFPRHLGTSRVRVFAPHHGLARANVDGRRLQPGDGWLPVGADEAVLECQLAPSGRVHGTLVDSLSGAPMQAVTAVLRAYAGSSAEQVVARGESDASGVVDLEVPAWLRATPLELAFEPLGAPLQRAWPEAPVWDEALPQAWFLERPPGDRLVLRGEVRDIAGNGVPAEVAVWSAPAGSVDPDEVVYEPEAPWRREWQGQAAADGLFLARAPVAADDLLAVVARRVDAANGMHVATWGPGPVAEALAGALSLDLRPPKGLRIEVAQLAEHGGYSVVERLWTPWGGPYLESVLWRGAARDAPGASTRRGSSVDLRREFPLQAALQLDLRRAREPVDLTEDWTVWPDAGPEQARRPRPSLRLRLASSAKRLHAGFVSRALAAAWPDLGLALLGAPTRHERPDDLGRHDTWTRISREGSFALPIPSSRERPLLALLYRPLPDGALELLWSLEVDGNRLPEELPPRDAPLQAPVRVEAYRPP